MEVLLAPAVAAVAAAVIVLPGFHAVDPQPGTGTLLSGAIPFARTHVNPGYVYLPPGFTLARRYPVVYLLHGMPGSPNEYTNSLQLESWSNDEIGSGALQPFIAVVPSAVQKRSAEWAGPWETYLVSSVVPWIDAHLPTIASPQGRVLAGLSAGGFGAYDIGLRHPDVFGRIASWSGYFHPLHDGPFKHADAETLVANDPWILLHREAATLRRDGTRFFLSTGPPHSHWEKPAETIAFGKALDKAGLHATVLRVRSLRRHWRLEFQAGMRWAFAA